MNPNIPARVRLIDDGNHLVEAAPLAPAEQTPG